METSILKITEVVLPNINVERKENNDFITDYIEVCNEVRRHLAIFAALAPEELLDKSKQGILLGHMVRLYKLYDSFIFLIVNNRAEIGMILLRSMAETAINLKYLLKEFDNSQLFMKFKKASLAYEKKLWDEIEERKIEPPLPIETRMQESIKKTFERSGFKLQNVSWNDRKWSEDLFQRAGRVGIQSVYEFMFRTFCHSVHGTWHDLEFQHLIDKNQSYYEPNLEYSGADCKLLESSSILCLHAAKEYGKKVCNCSDPILSSNVECIDNWFKSMSDLHEKFLSSN